MDEFAQIGKSALHGEQGIHFQFEAGEQLGAGGLARVGAHDEFVGAIVENEHVNRLGFGIDDPVFLYAVLFVKVAFFDAVAGAPIKRHDFSREIDRSHDHPLDYVQAIFADVGDIGWTQWCGDRTMSIGAAMTSLRSFCETHSSSFL